MTIIGNTLALLFVLSVLVVLHEFGHFAVAKAFGFPVEVFSVGFGKRLFGRKWRGTDYRVSAIPLGGYVRVIGLGPDESTLAEGTSQEAPAVGKRWQRALILLAGPLMNVLLALVLHTAVFAIGVRVPAYELEAPVVKVVEEKSPGAEAGFRPGASSSYAGTRTPIANTAVWRTSARRMFMRGPARRMSARCHRFPTGGASVEVPSASVDSSGPSPMTRT